MRGADRDSARHAITFDPVVEGARHGLSRELSLELWKLVREESATIPEQADLEPAKPRFHELAAQLAARGAKLRADVGRLTRMAVELDGVPTARAALDALRPHVPGRETQVIVEARRRASLEPQLEAATQAGEAARPAPVVTATRPELPGAEVRAERTTTERLSGGGRRGCAGRGRHVRGRSGRHGVPRARLGETPRAIWSAFEPGSLPESGEHVALHREVRG
jgi:hypothetical protein